MPLTLAEVKNHNSKKFCWVIIKNNVYDVTEFLDEHPGGAAAILKYAGRDATAAYEPIHPPGALKHLPPSKHLGPLDETSAKTVSDAQANRVKTKDDIRSEIAHKYKPPLYRILSLPEMEVVARRVMTHKALAYYSSSADDQTAYFENARAFSRFFFRARVLRPVSRCDPSTHILGFPSSIPVLACGTGLARLGHPDGEANITRGCHARGAIQMVSSNASLSYEQIMAAAAPGQTIFFQLYKDARDEVAERRVHDVEALGYKAIFLTVDAIVPGKREFDIRSPWYLEEQERGGPLEYVEEQTGTPDGNLLGTAGALISGTDQDMTWEKTIPWLRRVTKLPIVVKGIECDALLAKEAGVDGILISNHGGTAFPPMEILYRLRMQHPECFNGMEVYIDGGITRGSDVVKALCLGATAVGLGRPFLYAQAAYGAKGVEKILEILDNEILSCMRHIGVTSVAELNPSLVERVDWEPYYRARL
ncbi:hypothetical protein FISHEDRAFT_49216 [Fistulina hepatica ATCC 64428]|uniref:Cytochrome b2 n=1 Tax=Fistulina hepatica ATCC 64428 TaxID=1128425 RepID=A0A0D7A4Z6_9AGAR|nr:hypothetical protein FISHEDRAFT_49216 [Fistulina hepatica ATCC 64428]